MSNENPAKKMTPPPLPPRPKRTSPQPVVVELASDELVSMPEAGELQDPDVVNAFEVKGFKGISVFATLEKKDESKGDGKPNEDNILADPETGLVGVFDGLGGMKNGALASETAEATLPDAYADAMKKNRKLAIEDVITRLTDSQVMRNGSEKLRKTISSMMETVAKKDPDLIRSALALVEAMQQAHEAVKRTEGMTTACIGRVHKSLDGTDWAIVANIGDSAAYKRRPAGELVPLTTEDSMLNALQSRGLLDATKLNAMKAQPDAPIFQYGKKHKISYHEMKAAVMESLGGSETGGTPGLTIQRLNPSEELFFVTDGVADKYDDPKTDETNLDRLGQDMDIGSDPIERLNILRSIAKRRTTYKKDDDIAIVLVRGRS